MATTTKVIVQIHERTTYAQLTTDLQLRELGYESTNDSFNFNNNAGTNLTIWAKESTGVTYDNNVGIGKVPTVALDVETTDTTVARFKHSDGATVWVELENNTGDYFMGYGAAGLLLSPDTSTVDLVIDSSGDVGIGASPDTRLHITDSGAVVTVEDSGTHSSGVNGGSITFKGNDSGAAQRPLGGVSGLSKGSQNGQLAFYIGNSGALTEKARIDEDGNFGIGTTSPDGTLHVHTATAGSVTANAGADELVVENSTHGGISILGPDASEQNIYWGTPTDSVGAIARWVHNDDIFRIGAANTGASTILTSGAFVDAVTIDSTGKVDVEIDDLEVLTTGKKVIINTTNGYGEFYGNGASTTINATTDDLVLSIEDAAHLTISSGELEVASGKIFKTAASGTSQAGLNLPHGTAPSAPADGDVWTVANTGLFVRVDEGASSASYQMPLVTAGAATVDLDQAASATDTTWYWTKSDDQVTVTPQADFSATATATTVFTLSGIPTNLRPTTVPVILYCYVYNNADKEPGKIKINTDGTATVYRWDGTDFVNTWTASTLRGVFGMPAFTYKIL